MEKRVENFFAPSATELRPISNERADSKLSKAIKFNLWKVVEKKLWCFEVRPYSKIF